LIPSKWTMVKRNLTWILFLVAFAGCNLPGASDSNPDLFATLQASTPSLSSSPPPPALTDIPDFDFPTVPPATFPSTSSVPPPSPSDQLAGHIVFTCQIFRIQAQNQICIMNADGSNVRRLTTDNSRQHYYPSLSPDGGSVLYAAFLETDNYEIYELKLSDGNVTRLTNTPGVDNAPEVSPDGKKIAFMRAPSGTTRYQIMLMDRDGGNAANIPQTVGWDPTWSPDGNQILFASNTSGTVQLHTIHLDGGNLESLSNLSAVRGRSDWSPDGRYIVTYSGPAWNRELYIMNADGTNVRQLTPGGGNSQGPSFSPDGKWVAFTAYFDKSGDDHGCEIYVIRVDGTDLRRLTNNDYCDYQPRWGP
jgi:TolB protein